MLNINDRKDSKKLHPRLYTSTFLILIWVIPLTMAAQNDTLVQHYGGDTLRVAPDGTEGAVIAVRKPDSASNKLPPNEFKGSLSTFKIGLGYIHDGTTYIQSEKFKQQMDSAKLDVHSQFKLRDFRILGSGV
jgi:hypothetical protein